MSAPKGAEVHETPSPPPIDYAGDHADAPTKGALRIGGLAIGISALICFAFVLFVVTRSGGL